MIRLTLRGSGDESDTARLLTVLALVGSGRAQQRDPYADSYRQQQIEHYNQQIAKLREASERIYFAAACKVFQSAIGA